jgi:hypothetical protein
MPTKVRMMRGPLFRVGEIFPASDEDRVRLARLLVAMQPLVVTARLVYFLGDDGQRSPAEEESLQVLKVQSLGPTFEALKAFKAADRPGVFSAEVRHPPGVEDAYQRLRGRVKNKKFLEQLREARNQVIAHVDCDQLKPVLERLADVELPVYLGTGRETTEDTAVPLIGKLAKGVLEDRLPGADDFANKELWRIQSDLWKVAHAALAYYVAKALDTLQTDAE